RGRLLRGRLLFLLGGGLLGGGLALLGFPLGALVALPRCALFFFDRGPGLGLAFALDLLAALAGLLGLALGFLAREGVGADQREGRGEEFARVAHLGAVLGRRQLGLRRGRGEELHRGLRRGRRGLRAGPARRLVRGAALERAGGRARLELPRPVAAALDDLLDERLRVAVHLD
ncbi:MAG: hypothetical protein ACK56I_13680, partial [bacterium]